MAKRRRSVLAMAHDLKLIADRVVRLDDAMHTNGCSTAAWESTLHDLQNMAAALLARIQEEARR